ncbi:MAG: hypothetical protein CK427_02305 [Leptospira sp.]|nr:MAG: hypothetical protein CK427_02305 [Leptospira sp.]
MYQKAYLILSIFILASHCLNFPSAKSSQAEFPVSKYIYKIAHNQVFLKVYVQSLGSSQVQERWALLDSGSTVNLMLDNNLEKEIKQIAWLPNSVDFSKMEFHNLGSALPKDYDLVLGAPFFLAHCLIFENAVPISIEQNHKKKCFTSLRHESSKENFPSQRITIDLIAKEGLVHATVQIGTKQELMAIDTGSGLSSLPYSKFQEELVSLNQSIYVMDIYGKKNSRKLYSLARPIHLKELAFDPAKILDSDEVWDRKEGYSSTLGVDFLKTFRVYIDFGSKILGIDSNESKQGQDHSRNEWGSR